jgi:hypothetical protein
MPTQTDKLYHFLMITTTNHIEITPIDRFIKRIDDQFLAWFKWFAR